ncbi:MAG: GNAT family N-acetyltransferase [Oscillospiraceae bacterium]|nr:GNAT family N-acetyltransferase [Oscillospiraceae bacterium]
MIELHGEARPSVAALLEKDFAAFNLLARILRSPLDTILTDDESFILTFSSPVYPVWVWTKDDLPDDTAEEIWNILKTRYPLTEGYHYNTKHSFASKLQKFGEREGIRIDSGFHLLAYECENVVFPSFPIEGSFYRCTEGDIDLLADWFTDFHNELQMDIASRDAYLAEIRERIQNGAFFFWKVDGKPVSFCSYAVSEGFCSVSHVFTSKLHRRHHYAEILVAKATEEILSKGYRALLYTDAGYPASNACYQKIGYQLKGSLVSVTLSE